MTDLSEVAASVAKALELGQPGHVYLDGIFLLSGWAVGTEVLSRDGRGLTDPYWFKRCMQWLLEHGVVELGQDDNTIHGFRPASGPIESFDILCPWDEFPARAIHELMHRNP